MKLYYKILKSPQAASNLVGPASAGAGLQPRMRRPEGRRRLSRNPPANSLISLARGNGFLILATPASRSLMLKSAPPRIRCGYAALYYNSMKSSQVATNLIRAATVRERDTCGGNFGCGHAALWGRMASCAPVVNRRHTRVANPPQVDNLPHRQRAILPGLGS
jgi:hypothetical protein